MDFLAFAMEISLVQPDVSLTKTAISPRGIVLENAYFQVTTFLHSFCSEPLDLIKYHVFLY